MLFQKSEDLIHALANHLHANGGRTPLLVLNKGTLTSFVVNTDPESKTPLIKTPSISRPQHSVVVFNPAEISKEVVELLDAAVEFAVFRLGDGLTSVWAAATSYPMGAVLRGFARINAASSFIDTAALPSRSQPKQKRAMPSK